jgi:hypothetical protein
MRLNKLLMLSLAVGLSLASCTKNSNNKQVSAPAMSQYYFLPAYVTDQTAPSFTYKANTAITTAMPDAIYYTTGIPATGVTFTLKDQTGATLTTLTGVPQVPAGATIYPNQYYIINLPSSFIIPATWVGKTITITVSNSTAFTEYKII